MPPHSLLLRACLCRLLCLLTVGAVNNGAEPMLVQHLFVGAQVWAMATGVTPKLMRPPYGAFTARQRAWAYGNWGYKCILWDVDPLDWKIRNSEHVKSEILKGAVAGSIILSHDIHKQTVDAMPATLDGLIAKGFKFATVSQLIAMNKPKPPPSQAAEGERPRSTKNRKSLPVPAQAESAQTLKSENASESGPTPTPTATPAGGHR